MKKDLKIFIKKNFKIINKYKSNEGLLLVDRGRIANSFYQIFLSKILIDKFKLNCKVVTDKNLKSSDHVKFYKSFGFVEFLNVFNYKEILYQDCIISLKSLFITLISTLKVYLFGFRWLIDHFKLDNILLGDLIYDTYIRTKLGFIKPKIDLHFCNIFFKTIFRTLSLKKIIKKNQTKFIIIGTYTYAYNGPIALRLGLEKNIEVLEAGRRFLWKYSKYNLKNGFDYSLVQKNKIFIKKIASMKKINKFLDDRKSGKVKLYFTRNKDIKKYKFVTRSDLLKKFNLNKKNIKKIVLIATHKFSESPHAKGNLIFRDYYDQFIKTLEYFNKNNDKDVLCIFRPHPSSHEFNEESVIKNEIHKLNNKIIKLCPKNISSYNLSEICDTVITGRGTIGLEFACKGKKPILAGQATYSKNNFTYEPYNQSEYFKILSSIKNIKYLNNNKTNLAKKILYFLENHKINLIESKIVPDEISKKISQNLIKIVNKNLINMKYENDLYFKKLKKEINDIYN